MSTKPSKTTTLRRIKAMTVRSSAEMLALYQHRLFVECMSKSLAYGLPGIMNVGMSYNDGIDCEYYFKTTDSKIIYRVTFETDLTLSTFEHLVGTLCLLQPLNGDMDSWSVVKSFDID